MTLLEYDALYKRYLARLDHETYCASLIATTVYNMNINPKKTKPLKPDHFVPKRKKRQTSEQQKQMAQAIATLTHGKVVE